MRSWQSDTVGKSNRHNDNDLIAMKELDSEWRGVRKFQSAICAPTSPNRGAA